jgi:hypothetical protein
VTVANGEQTQNVTFTEANIADSVTVDVPLSGTDAAEEITITVSHKETGSVAQTYTLKVDKLPPVATTFAVDPADATIYLTDDISKARIYPEADGSYILNTDGSYTYVISKTGYVAKTAQFVASEENKTITAQLEKASASDLKDISTEGDWLQFRADNNNNGVVNVKTPVKAEDAVLEWANKIGEGFDSGATGCPIIVGGYLYTYAGDAIHKVNKETGEVVKSGKMAGSSSFAINSPTYGNGMIFVALSNGRVQAFDAENLTSLWVYKDALGGQPNCPIAYSDGYIYTGFWNSETKQANFVCLSVTDEDTTNTTEAKLATWTYAHNGFYWAGAYACEDYVLVGTDDGSDGYTTGTASILSLHPTTGVLLDEQKLTNVGDQRSSICYDEATDAYYFTTKGGDFYQIKVEANGTFTEDSLRRLHLDNGAYDMRTPPMSTSTPVIYNGRAYIGVSGISQFGNFSGHNMTVIDLETFSIAYTVPTMGYPQTSGLLTTAYENTDGYVYVYFIDNASPGMIRVIRDKKGMDEVDHSYTTMTTYSVNGEKKTIETGYVLFTPYGDEEQYAICSPISDAEGNLYFKNDSARMMRLSSRMTSLEIVQQPEKKDYCVGKTFDGTGMKVIAHYANGSSKDVTRYVSFTTDPLTVDDTEITVSFAPDKMFENEDTAAGGYWQWYRDVDGQTGQTYYLPTATVTVQIREDHTWNSGEQTKAPTCTEAGETTYICDVCGETKTEVGDPARGHQMGDFVVTKEPTATEMGEETAKCANCDYTETRQIPVKVEQERITVGSASLSFEDEVLVNLYYTTTDMPGVTAENMGLLTWAVQPVEGTIDDADQVLPGALYDEAKGHYMVQTRGIAAKNLGDDIYMRVYAKLADGSYIYSNLVTYSPKKYALSRLENSNSEKLKALCVAMLNYGAAAQKYFGYKTDNLMNADLTAEQQALVTAYDAGLFAGAVAPDTAKAGAFTATASGFSKKAASVSFEGAFAINYYFTPSAAVSGDMVLYYWDEATYGSIDVLTADNASGTVIMVAGADGRYWGQVDGIAAKKLDDTYYVAAVYTDGDGNSDCSGVVAYSLSQYCINKAQDGKVMQDLAANTAMYGYYAKLYFTT